MKERKRAKIKASIKKWDERYLEMAALVSTWSKDPRKQVGAVVIQDGFIRGVGFNGFPKGVAHTNERLGHKVTKNKIMIHAEVNALVAAELQADTIYVWPCLPCSQCMGLIIQSGITRVVTGPLDEGTEWDQELAIELAVEAKIEVRIMEEV